MNLALKRWVRREANLKSHLDHENANHDLHPSTLLRYVAHVDALDEDSVPGAPESPTAPKAPVEPIPPVSPESPVAPKAPDGAKPSFDGGPADNAVPPVDASPPAANGNDEYAYEEDPSPVDDPQVLLARDLLLAADGSVEKNDLLKHLQPALKKISEREDKRLTHELSLLGVDWTIPADDFWAAPTLRVAVTTDASDSQYDAGEDVELRVQVTNTGDTPAYRVYAVTNASTSRFEDHELVFGRIEPGQSITRTRVVETRLNQRTRYDVIDVEVFADRGHALDGETVVAAATTPLRTKGPALPHFAYTYTVLDEPGDGNSMGSIGEAMTLRFFVENLGVGSSNEPVSYLKNKSGGQAFLLDAREKGGVIEAGERRVYDFRFQVREGEADELEFELHVYDAELGRTLIGRVVVAVASDPEKAVARSGSATVSSDAVALRSAPLEDADVVAMVGPGDVFALQREMGGFVQVASGDVVGWLPTTAVVVGDVVPQQTADVALSYVGYAPRVQLTAAEFVTTEEEILVTGVANDDSGLQDFHMFVVNEQDHVYESRKVVYRRLAGTQAEFSVTVPLRKGMNRIKVVTRDEDEMEVVDSVYVYRK